jgi:GNAT superfamily N-acetyltransferase
MSDEWMPSLTLKLSREDFERLPRHPAYKYELLDGVTYISPWPRYSHAQLRLARFRVDQSDVTKLPMRLAKVDDVEALIPILLGAFARLQPFGSLGEEKAHAAAEKSLHQAFAGGDGPLIESASFVALEEDQPAGAILLTLLPGGEPAERDSYSWHEPAPSDLWDNAKGQPHLTWIFVRRFSQGSGVGTQLLQKAVRVLKKQGYKTLWTTFQQGNDSSALWHWRNGFELLPNMMSKRRMRRELGLPI